MHPALKLENLSRPPTYVRGFAIAAAKGSLEDLMQLFNLMARERNLREQYMLCLPVFYMNLDLAPIPGDGPSCSTRARVIITLKVLRVLENSPPDAGVDLWPRIWGWLSHLHRSHASFPRSPTEMDICSDLLAFVRHLGSDTPSLKLMGNTAGVRVLITRTWKLMFQIQGKETNPTALGALFWVFHFFLKIDVFVNWEEAVAGAGGTETDLARLIAQFIDFFIPTSRTVLVPNTLQYMDAVFCPLMVLYKESSLPALVAGGLVKSLTHVMCSFSASNFRQTEDIMGAALPLLLKIFVQAQQHLVIRDALAAGFLCAIVSYDIRGLDDEWMTDALKRISILTMFYTVVCQLETALRDVDDLVVQPVFEKSAIFEAWMSFRDLAEERIATAKIWNSEQGAPTKACDNMDCGEIRPKTDFKCCGNCHQVYYCSRK
ncbi:hypothetical protein B0H17DRAFT_306448 [Mycena rosella]|uniref:MYND-type domain-containing protein n=1 Tax=Mycena rosella TaxID=1033263 RepID=A0AAD7DW70_MYCRO|nr:hypothetical protein B0H17DRAFT_306448 [Mycena rosella]